MEFIDYYRGLGISKTTSKLNVKKAYSKLASIGKMARPMSRHKISGAGQHNMALIATSAVMHNKIT
jgi:preprotein translocase subunit Sec63